MVLENDICCVNIKIDDMYTVESTDNKLYDLMYNPKLYKHGDIYKTLSIDIDLFYEKYRIALIGDFYSYDMDCAVLEEDLLTILQNDVIIQISVTDGKLIRHTQFKCFGCNYGIYRIKDGYIIYGEIEITKLDLEFNKMWSFSGRDAFVSERQQKCFEICKNSIKLYDYEDNYYEIDFDGNLLQDIKTNEVNIDCEKHAVSQVAITSKKDKWKFIVIFCLLIMMSIFLYIGREEMIFFIIGCVLFIITLLIINWVNKMSND